MPVTGSSFTLEHAQADGSRWCREVHTATGGGQEVFYYLTPGNADHQAIMQARVASVNEQLAEQEARNNLDRDGAHTTVHQTAAQFVARFREAVRQATREEACRLAWWILRRIAAGHVTDTQARNAFGMTAGVWTTFKTTKLQPRHDAWATVLAATGE